MNSSLKDRLPNRSLSGPELAQIIRFELKQMLESDQAYSPTVAYAMAAFTIRMKITLPTPHAPIDTGSRTKAATHKCLTGERLREYIALELENMVSREYIFGLAGAYKHSNITLSVVSHLVDPWILKDGEERAGLIVGPAPILPVPANASVVGLQREIKLENPNLDRIHHDMPIIVQRATLPQPMTNPQLPGEAPQVGMPGVENKEYRWDPATMPATTPAVQTDISQQAAALMGVPVQTGV